MMRRLLEKIAKGLDIELGVVITGVESKAAAGGVRAFCAQGQVLRGYAMICQADHSSPQQIIADQGRS